MYRVPSSIYQIPRRAFSLAPNVPKAPAPFRIGFPDSGVGGIFFMIKAMEHLTDFILNSESKYNVAISGIHLADSANFPYGAHAPSKIQRFTQDAVGYLFESEKCQVVSVACNTASSITEPDPHPFNLVNQNVIFPIRRSAEYIYSKRQFKPNGPTWEFHFALFSTPTTATSNLYPDHLAKLHSREFGPKSITIALPADNNLNMPRIYRGIHALDHGSSDEIHAISEIQNKASSSPVQYLHIFAPSRWAKMIERSDSSIGEEVHNDLNKMTLNVPRRHLQRLSGAALCCTHFMTIDRSLREWLWRNDLLSVPIINPAEYIAEKALLPTISSILNREYEERDRPIPINQILPIKLYSKSTIAPGTNPETTLARMKKAADTFSPGAAKTIDFSAIQQYNITKFKKRAHA